MFKSGIDSRIFRIQRISKENVHTEHKLGSEAFRETPEDDDEKEEIVVYLPTSAIFYFSFFCPSSKLARNVVLQNSESITRSEGFLSPSKKRERERK